HRSYAAGYLLDPGGMTWYTAPGVTTQRYDELYGKIQMISVGLHADLNVNRIFGIPAARYPLKLIVSPAVYANTFSPKIYTLSDDKKYVSGNQSQSISMGLGGDVAVRYDIKHSVGVQLKGTGIWITDNLFDNIRTVGHVKQNAMWAISAGVVWNIKSSPGYHK
ncbi:MAG: hypothetical protein LIO77_01220, partial [Rikenellaceae bacterium]|nr:hypothetical protein [Rikenellaceae bacterium]